MLLGLSTGNTIGLTTVAAVFIAFALVSSFVVPRRRPDFPGRAGLPVYVIASLTLFFAMVGSIVVFARESEAAAGEAPMELASAAGATATFEVQENDSHIVLPAAATQELAPGTYAFHVRNTGAKQHDFAIQPEASQQVLKTTLLQPGADATLTVTLPKGVYDLYSALPGQRQVGLATKISVS